MKPSRWSSFALVALSACASSSSPARAPVTGAGESVAPGDAEPATSDPDAAPNRSDPAAGDGAPAGLAAQLLDAHNVARRAHCAPPLAWSTELAAMAQRWADALRAQGCAFEHSTNSYGENLAAGSAGSLDAAAVVDMWVDERRAYDFAHGHFSLSTGHFTQVVWRATTRVGCGVATCEGLDLFVCNYDPPGNVEGGYADNVRARCR